MKYSVLVLDPGCKGPDGKPLGQDCPLLWRKEKDGWRITGKDGKPVWVGSRHGTAGWAARVPISGGLKLLKRYGYPTKTEAEAAAQHAGNLLALATDDATRKRIGDLIESARRGAALPAVADVARRLGVGLDPASTGISTGEAWHAWLAGRSGSARRRLNGLRSLGTTGFSPSWPTCRWSG